jgi:polysaccharide pyruvyl transferase CsaB
MYTLLIGGYYGAGNIGDEAILECMLGDLRALNNDLKLIVVSWNPEFTRRQYNVESFHWKDIDALFEAVKRSDLVILGGGGLFQNYWGLDPQTYLRKNYWDISAYGSLPLLARLNNTPAMLYAVGLGPLSNEIALQHTRLAFENCQLATLRDDQSMSILRESGYPFDSSATLTPQVLSDPVFSLGTSPDDEIQVNEYFHQLQIGGEHKLIGVVLRYWDFSAPYKTWLKNTAKGLRGFLISHKNFDVVLIPFHNNKENPYTDDRGVLSDFAALVGEAAPIHIVDKEITPRFAQALLGKCALIMGMRLHSLIMGINVNIPVIGLSYDLKVVSLMKNAGLEDYCISLSDLDADTLTQKLDKGLHEKDSIIKSMKIFQEKSAIDAKKNAELALMLIKKFHKVPETLFQNLILSKARLIPELDFQIEQLSKENSILQEQLKEYDQIKKNFDQKGAEIKQLHEENQMLVQQLNSIYHSKSWKLANTYHKITNTVIFRKMYDLLKIKNHILAIQKKINDLLGKLRPPKTEKPPDNALADIIKQLNSKKLKGVFILTSTVRFNNFNNQRVLHLARFLSKRGWGILFVAWRWSQEELFPNIDEPVIRNVFQIPVDVFLEKQELFGVVNCAKKYLVFEYPFPGFFITALKLKGYGYKIIYDIIDDWEEFSKVGQSVWFNKIFERALVLNSDFLSGVSQPLADKFKDLRKDISIVPNGYSPELLGRRHRNIARKVFDPDDIHIGYFGHLTDAWFDWNFLNNVLDRASQIGKNITFHLIGYGEPEGRVSTHPKNIILHGRVNPNDLYRYVMKWDLAMIPFMSGKLAEAADPLKVYEYAFFGLPVIVKGINHLAGFPKLLVVSDEDEFLDAIDILKGNKRPEEGIQKNHTLSTIKYLPSGDHGKDVDWGKVVAESSWEKRFIQLLEKIDQKWIF